MANLFHLRLSQKRTPPLPLSTSRDPPRQVSSGRLPRAQEKEQVKRAIPPQCPDEHDLDPEDTTTTPPRGYGEFPGVLEPCFVDGGSAQFSGLNTSAWDRLESFNPALSLPSCGAWEAISPLSTPASPLGDGAEVPASGHYEALSSQLASITLLSLGLLPDAGTSITYPSLRRTLREHTPCLTWGGAPWAGGRVQPTLSAGEVHRVGAVSSHLTATSRKNPRFAFIACYSFFYFSI